MIYNFLSILTLTSIFFLNIFFKSQINPDKKENTVLIPTVNNLILNDDAILKKLIDTTIPKIISIDLKKVKKIEVLSINKEIGKDSTNVEDYEKCKSWSLTIDQLKFVIRKFVQMSSESRYLTYLYMPCNMKGEIKIDSIEFRYWIGAGSTLTLKNKDTTLYFGCPGNKCKKFFLSGKDDY